MRGESGWCFKIWLPSYGQRNIHLTTGNLYIAVRSLVMHRLFWNPGGGNRGQWFFQWQTPAQTLLSWHQLIGRLVDSATKPIQDIPFQKVSRKGFPAQPQHHQFWHMTFVSNSLSNVENYSCGKNPTWHANLKASSSVRSGQACMPKASPF